MHIHKTTTGENSTGALTTRLEEDANIMAQATGLELGHKVHIAMTLIIGIIIGLIVAWQVGLVAMAVVPLIGKCTSHGTHVTNGCDVLSATASPKH
jgi:ABC-type bacteriocin/lantibiotic exporter with double-glycine peptidase domain